MQEKDIVTIHCGVLRDTRKKLNTDAAQLEMKQNQYLEQLIWGLITPPKTLITPEKTVEYVVGHNNKILNKAETQTPDYVEIAPEYKNTPFVKTADELHFDDQPYIIPFDDGTVRAMRTQPIETQEPEEAGKAHE